MTAEFVLRNLAIYSLQVGVLTLFAAIAVWAAKLRAPRPLLGYWYGVLALTFLLPVVSPWRSPAVAALEEIHITTGPLRIADGAANRFDWSWIPSWPTLLLAAIAAGALVRLLWLVIGLLRLERLRRTAEMLEVRPEGAFLRSPEVTSPVTFGYRSPVVLLPAAFFALSPDEQRAVSMHEWIHIVRRDWLATIAEEIARAVLWFHPAVWFTLNRLQLAREQLVDEEVVRATGEPENYIGALLKIASSRIQADLAPAPLLLKKRHLRERVAAIVQGRNMSQQRIRFTMIALLALLPTAAGLLAWQLPLQAAPQEVMDARGVQVDTGQFKVLHRKPVYYPTDAIRSSIGGDVVVELDLAAKGEVNDARIISGPPELRKAVLASVLNWHFAESQAGTKAVITVRFKPDAGSQSVLAGMSAEQYAREMTFHKLDVSSLPAPLRGQVEASANFQAGHEYTMDEMKNLFQTFKTIDPHLRPSVRNTPNGDHVMVVELQETSVNNQLSAASQASSTGPKIRVGGDRQAANLIKKVTPKYPPEAKAAGVQGQVKFEATIGPDGAIQDLKLLGGPPELVPSATEAVKQWVYRPTLLNGNPVTVITQIDVNYTLMP